MRLGISMCITRIVVESLLQNFERFDGNKYVTKILIFASSGSFWHQSLKFETRPVDM